MIEFYRNLIQDNEILLLYLTSVIVDILLGNIAAWYTNDVDSSVGLRGTIKHLGLLAFVMLFLPVLSLYMGNNILSISIVSYMVYQYVISIIENLSILGFEMPDWIEEKLRRLRETNEIDVSDSATVKIDVAKYKNLKEVEHDKTTKDS